MHRGSVTWHFRPRVCTIGGLDEFTTSILTFPFDFHGLPRFLPYNCRHWVSKNFIVQHRLRHPLHVPGWRCYVHNFTGKVGLKFDAFKIFVNFFVDEALKNGSWTAVRIWDFTEALAGFQSDHGVFVQARNDCDNIPQRCLTYGYRRFSARRVFFLGLVLLRNNITWKGFEGIFSIAGGSKRFRSFKESSFTSECQGDLRPSNVLGRLHWSSSQVGTSGLGNSY